MSDPSQVHGELSSPRASLYWDARCPFPFLGWKAPAKLTAQTEVRNHDVRTLADTGRKGALSAKGGGSAWIRQSSSCRDEDSQPEAGATQPRGELRSLWFPPISRLTCTPETSSSWPRKSLFCLKSFGDFLKFCFSFFCDWNSLI